MGRLDRYGEPIDDDPDDPDDPDDSGDVQPEHDPRCRGGWLDDDPAGRPIPCLTCRPHLKDRT